MMFERRDVVRGIVLAGLVPERIAAGFGAPDPARNVGSTSDASVVLDQLRNMARSGRADLATGVYRMMEPLSIPPGILGGGDVTLDFRGADPTRFAEGICVRIEGAPKTALPRLAAGLAIGDRRFLFAAAHGMAVGDAFLLAGTKDGAGNGYRPYYRKGEMFRVARVISAIAVETASVCRDSYLAGEVACWKRRRDTFGQECSRLRILAPDTIDFPVRFITLDDVGIHNLHVEGGAVSAIDFLDCYGVEGQGLSARQVAKTHDGYGISITNCQDFRIAGDVYGFFNGIATGGGSRLVAAVAGMNRDIHFSGTAGSDPVRGLSGANFHGNTEYSSYRGIFANGVVLAGNRNEAQGTFLAKAGAPGVIFTEMHGHSFRVSGTVETKGSDLPSNVGAINMGSSGDDYGRCARYGGRAILDVTVKAPNASRIVLWRMTDLTRSDVVLDLRRLDLEILHPTTRIMVLSKNRGGDLPSLEIQQLDVRDTRVAIRWSLDRRTRVSGPGRRAPGGPEIRL